MTATLLRAADPAAALNPDPLSPPARALLADIVSHPRPRGPHLAGGRQRVRRIVIGGAFVGAAATVALAVPMPWDGHGSGLGSAAYAVSVNRDGTVRVVMRWSELSNPAKLQAALDRADAPVRILTGRSYALSDGIRPVPACAEPTSGVPYSARAVQWDFPNAASEVNGVVIRPKYFPPHGTLVIEVFYEAGTTRQSGTQSYMVIGKPPTCAQPSYDSTTSGLPVHGSPTR